VGGPRTTQRRSAMLLHHSVGDFGTMQQAYSHITAAAVLLGDPAEAPQRIDRAFARCIAEKRPIMIEIPADMDISAHSNCHNRTGNGVNRSHQMVDALSRFKQIPKRFRTLRSKGFDRWDL